MFRKVKSRKVRIAACILVMMLIVSQMLGLTAYASETSSQAQIVLTLGADLSAEQKAYVLEYFGIGENQVKTITITNADEKSHLGNLISAEAIGTRTLSCALIKLTAEGGIQVKTANMNYVTSNMIASTLSTSGVYNCEVLTAAPFEVSGTGALTGVMMAYEAASGAVLDPEKKALANEELVITGEIAGSVGQDHATLVVNDIKIHIVRDQIQGQENVNAVVDEVVETTYNAAVRAAEEQGLRAPERLGEVETQKLYNFGNKFSQMGYEYKNMQHTLERVTYNITKSSGIDDPITDTFTTITEDSSLSLDSILLNTNDSVLGDDANINATNSVAVGDHPAEPIEVFSGDVVLTDGGTIKSTYFINSTNVLAYQDVNGSYSLIDLNGNILTDALYGPYFRGSNGLIEAELDDGSGMSGVLTSYGDILVPCQYPVAEIFGEKWAAGITLTETTEEEYDYYGSDTNYLIQTVDIYYLGTEGSVLAGTLTRDQYSGTTSVMDDYIMIRDRSGLYTLYDNTFTPLQTGEYSGDFESYDENYALAEALSNLTGYYVGGFYDNSGYARVTDYNKNGIIDRYGNMIVPMQYDAFYTHYDALGNTDYEFGGYFAAKNGDDFVYVTQDGTITASYTDTESNVYSYGMAARVEETDGSYTLIAGDGKITNLAGYTDVYSIHESDGMLWKGDKDGSHVLLDWHGNVLVADSDNYSVSANGNYVIAENGYTSSTLYLINDASPVKLSESIGGASELEVTIEESASLEAYTGNPTLQLVGDVPGDRFVEGTHLIQAEDMNGYSAVFDLSGNQLTDPIYSYFYYADGWLEACDGEGTLYGLVSEQGQEIIPCQYQHIEVLNENWVAAYVLKTGGTEADYDFRDYNNDDYLLIDEAVIYHISQDELSSVKLTRDQIADIAAEEDYISIMDRTTGAVTIYDASFTAVSSASFVGDFTGFSTKEVLIQQLEDQTGLSIYDYDFPDGYSRVADYSQEETKFGVIDMSGNIVVPLEYDRIQTYSTSQGSRIWANGYFAVEKGGMSGFVTADGTVTCELKYPSDDFYPAGIAVRIQNEDGTYSLAAADGTVSGPYDYLYSFEGGKLWRAQSAASYGYDLIDWHGNVLFENCDHFDVSFDDQYVIVQKKYGDAAQLYTVDGAEAPMAVGGAAAEAPQTDVLETESAQTETAPQTEAPEETESAQTEAAPQTEAPEETESAQTEEAAETEAAPEQTADPSASPAATMLVSVKTLLDSGVAVDSESVLVLLQQAKTLLDTENPAAATLINSAVTLLEAGASDAGSIQTLIDTALGML